MNKLTTITYVCILFRDSTNTGIETERDREKFLGPLFTYKASMCVLRLWMLLPLLNLTNFGPHAMVSVTSAENGGKESLNRSLVSVVGRASNE